EEVFHEVFESFQGESYSSSLNDDVQQSPKEVILPTSNTQSIPINMVPNGDEASTSHNVFNERLEDAYFDASTLVHDPSNVYTFYQPYPHEKKWTKDHPLHKIIGDPKSSVRTRGQLANSCLFSCLLSSLMRCYLLNDYEDVGKLKAKGDIRVFVGYSKESAAFRIYNKRTHLEDLFQDFYDEYFDSSKIIKSSITNVKTSINEEVFHEGSESFQGESFSSSLNDDKQQSPGEVILPQTSTQSIPINMVPNGDEASTSHNVFNE
nr:integrase, catalytic region, zinc finger, CCHC-type, peptidase aspartic, catalytic [Tanacetum cinerariifolium]